MNFALFLLAAAQQQQEDPLGGLMRMFGPILLMFFGLWFFLLRPAQKRERLQREQMLTSLKKNDKVLTNAGIIGIIAAVNEKEDELTLKVDESSNVRLRMLKSTIVKNYTAEEAARELAAKDKAEKDKAKEQATTAGKS
jgi:preprotein translocase subunit YajC